MEHHHDKKGAGVNGFLLGVIVGVVVTLLFTTKKGRQILKTLTDEGMSKFSELEELMQDMEEYDEEESETGPEEVPPHEEQNGENPSESPKKYIAKKSPLRRFFRGIPKRSN